MKRVDETAPLETLFPDYGKIAEMLRSEVAGLDDAALDWSSDEFGWAGWSIRVQSSHLGSVVYRWLLVRWRDQLFAGGIPVSDDELALLNSTSHDRRLNDETYWSTAQILGAVDGAMELAVSVLRRVTVGEAMSMTVSRAPSDHWRLMVMAHPRGATVDEDGGGTMTLEATFRHIRFEYLTHMDNMQKIKRHLGLKLAVKLPEEGYHKVEGWA